MLSLVRILLSLVTVTLVLGYVVVVPDGAGGSKDHQLLGPCKVIEVADIATIYIYNGVHHDSTIHLKWSDSFGRPDASGQMNTGGNSLTGYVNFPDDRRYSFHFYPEEDTIYWDGDKGSTGNIWRNAKCAASCKIDIPEIATIDLDDSKMHLKWTDRWGRPDASGQMNPRGNSFTGYVNFPDDRRYSFHFYPEEDTIYWDGDKGSTSNIWRNAKRQCESNIAVERQHVMAICKGEM